MTSQLPLTFWQNTQKPILRIKRVIPTTRSPVSHPVILNVIKKTPITAYCLTKLYTLKMDQIHLAKTYHLHWYFEIKRVSAQLGIIRTLKSTVHWYYHNLPIGILQRSYLKKKSFLKNLFYIHMMNLRVFRNYKSRSACKLNNVSIKLTLKKKSVVFGEYHCWLM